MIYLQLLWSFFQIGLFGIGGGYAAMPLIQNQVVTQHQWLTMEEFVDVVTISQMTPGPIAINSATFVGIRVAGYGGALVATLGCVLPSFIIVLILAKIYCKYRELSVMQGILSGLRPAVVALIASAGLAILVLSFWGSAPASYSLGNLDWKAALIFAVGIVVLRQWKPNPIWVMGGAGLAGMAVYLAF